MLIDEKNCRISAVIAVYNPNLEFFLRAVRSVLSQTYPVYELILVNDGGDDSFMEVLPVDERIKVYKKKNEGVAATRNAAISHASGDYIAFLDQDDYWYQEKLSEQLSLILKDEPVCMVTSPVEIISESGDLLQKKTRDATRLYLKKGGSKSLFLSLLDGNCIYSSTPLIHKDVFARIRSFDSVTQPHDDWDMYLRIVMADFPVHFYKKKALSVWRVHLKNESHKIGLMLRSKSAVEKKIIQSSDDNVVIHYAELNLRVDILERINIVYKCGHFLAFRRLVMSGALKPGLRYSGSFLTVVSEYEVYRRFRKKIIKTFRRYVVSFVR